ncbi:helix-turn-helix domain-containing protein [Exilibacterium tricleocarpae]|uniref:Helix-turn-helix domain-containing protein n=1 Tax=Exilibacterium tricleocarpae TaxID=2591008 RepID=A0A545TNB6_9GAMM|nr:helix-turn-helix domain-containing protein [Exilibacterium tricleocarpae]TQV78714.1 helix-turn-helix domain-containing protein [Exilibacterium tricleocarpae]
MAAVKKATKNVNKKRKEEDSAEKSVWRRDSEAQQISGEMGARIRRFREQEKMSLNTASELTGIPAATLSRIETNKMSPTFPVLLKIMAGLKISLTDLISLDSPEKRNNIISVTMPGEAPSNTIHGYTHWAPNTDSAFSHLAQPLVFEVSAKNLEDAGGLKGHDGIEFCYVLGGMLTLHFEGQEPFDIPEGGSAMFAGKVPHSYVSKGRKKTKVLNIVMMDPVVNGGTPKKPFSVRKS